MTDRSVSHTNWNVLHGTFCAVANFFRRVNARLIRSDRRFTLSGMTRRQMVDIGVPPEEIRTALDKRSWQQEIDYWR